MSLLELAAAGLLDAPLNLTVRHAQAKRVRIDANPPLPYVIDGEVFEAEPLDIEILPHSLTVLG
jgi:diacylglycerol kinase family enzyme